MQHLKILNSKEKKKILQLIESQWGVKMRSELVFLQNMKSRIYIADRGFAEISTEHLRLETVGMYFGTLEHGELRLSFEGSQMIGPDATKNVVVLSRSEMLSILKGEDIDKPRLEPGFVILAYASEKGTDYLGTGRVKGGKILNYTPKSRRIATDDVPF